MVDMPARARRWVCALACLCIAASAFSAQAQSADVDADIDAIFRACNTMGGAVLVARRGELVYERYYGLADREQKRPVNRDTYFRAASVTKFVSGIGAMILVERGLLDLDADIGDTLGIPVGNPRFPGRPVTLRQLMTHTAGLYDNQGFSKADSTLRSLLVRNPRDNFTEHKPGSVYAYSNFGAGIVGTLMEAASGQSVNAFMAERVFAPMGIEAAFSASLLALPQNVVSTYRGERVTGKANDAIQEPYDDTCNPNAHIRTTIGRLWIRPRDLLKLMCLMGEGGELHGVRLLEAETVARMTQPQSGVGSVSGDTPYGLFTARLEGVLPGVTLYGHQGSTAGFVCNAYFDPETGYAFVLMTNGTDQRGDGTINNLARRLITYTYSMAVGEVQLDR